MRYILVFLLVILFGCSENKEPFPGKSSDTSTTEKQEIPAQELTESKIDTVLIQKEVKEIPLKQDVKEEKEEPEKEFTEAELWERYRKAKSSMELAKEKSDWAEIHKQLLIAAQSAELLNRPDIAAWQYNNIGFYAIEEFKKVTDYFTVLDKLNKLEFGKEKQKAYNNMIELFKKNFFILEAGNKHLKKAKEIDTDLNDEIRSKRINNNIIFIQEIKQLVEKNAE